MVFYSFRIKRIYKFLLLTLLFSQCDFKDYKPQKIYLDFPQIKQQGVLIACTEYNSTNYFIYRGQPMGFQYELLKLFANQMGLKLQIRVTNSLEKAYQELNSFHVHLIAMDLSPNEERNDMFNFTIPYNETRQVLVQRKPDNWQELTYMQLDSALIRNNKQLAGKTIYIQKNTVYHELLKDIERQNGEDIFIVEDDQNDIEKLITKVANGKIDYTICDEHIALVNQTYYPNIDVITALSKPVKLSWAVRKDSDSLLIMLNSWMKKFMKTNNYVALYTKYFRNPRYFRMVQSEFFSVKRGIISPFDNDIRLHSKRIGWDWRLLASLIYQESQFDPNAISWTGAYGLMQLMPFNLARFGIENSNSPSNQINAGTNIILELERIFYPFIWDKEERIKFILGAYNAGVGQIIDARMLAKKYGKNPYRWDNNVDSFILLKSYPKYYRDPITQFGYCRGEETYNFVLQVLERYHHYKNIIKE